MRRMHCDCTAGARQMRGGGLAEVCGGAAVARRGRGGRAVLRWWLGIGAAVAPSEAWKRRNGVAVKAQLKVSASES